MYKRAARILLTWLLAIVILAGLPVPALAAEKYMEGESADFQIVLDESGGASVTETWQCFFGGDTITRYRRSYTIEEPDTMDIRFTEILMDGVPMTMLEEPDESRPQGCAAVVREGNTSRVEMYLSALNESHTFEISYYVTNAVEVFNDAAEFHWDLTSGREAFDLAFMTGTVEIPYGTRDMGLYFWGHGPEENAYFDAVVDEDGMVNLFELYNEDIPADRGVYVRFAMPRELFPDSTRITDRDALQEILEEEHSLPETEPTEEPTFVPVEEPVTEYRKPMTWWEYWWTNFYYSHLWQLGPVMGFLRNLLMALTFVLLAVLLLFRKKLDQLVRKKFLPRQYGAVRKKPVTEPQYYRSLPDDLKPALVYKLITTYPGTREGEEALQKGSAFSATVLDLVDRGLLQLGRQGRGELSYFVTPQASQANLTPWERNVIDLYIGAGADREPRTTREITAYMRKEYSWCKQHYKDFGTLVDEGYGSLGLTVSNPGKKWPLGICLAAGGIWGTAIFLCTGLRNIPFGLFSWSGIPYGVVFGIVTGLLLGRLYRVFHPRFDCLTQDGENRYALWRAYGDFLRDFTLFDEREVQDVALWRKYLVYATALGCSEKVMETLRVKLPQVYNSLVDNHDVRESDPFRYDEIAASVASIEQEGGYTIRHTGSSSDTSSDSGGSSDWGGFSDSGDSSGSGSSGSDFD